MIADTPFHAMRALDKVVIEWDTVIQEVVDAGKFYKADRLVVATSRLAGGGLMSEIERFKQLGIVVEALDPSQRALGSDG